MGLEDVRVLIAEEDGPSARVVAAVLEAEGCTTWIASSAEEAFALFEIHRPEVVVLELVLPLMGGMSLARKLRGSEHGDPPLAIVALTATNGPETVSAAIAAGVDEYIRKPIEPLGFVAIVERLLGRG